MSTVSPISIALCPTITKIEGERLRVECSFAYQTEPTDGWTKATALFPDQSRCYETLAVCNIDKSCDTKLRALTDALIKRCHGKTIAKDIVEIPLNNSTHGQSQKYRIGAWGTVSPHELAELCEGFPMSLVDSVHDMKNRGITETPYTDEMSRMLSNGPEGSVFSWATKEKSMGIFNLASQARLHVELHEMEMQEDDGTSTTSGCATPGTMSMSAGSGPTTPTKTNSAALRWAPKPNRSIGTWGE
jgi:hypothetical protein